MGFVASTLLILSCLGLALTLPNRLARRSPTLAHHTLSWRAAPVRREKLQWWTVLLSTATLAGSVICALLSAAARIEHGHGHVPHDHFALSPEGIVVAVPVDPGWWSALPPELWLLPVPLMLLITVLVPWLALQSQWQLSGDSERLTIQRAWPPLYRRIPWAQITEVYAAGATLHVEVGRRTLALRAEGAELDVAAAARAIALARDQARSVAQSDDASAAQSDDASAGPPALQRLRARAAEGSR